MYLHRKKDRPQPSVRCPDCGWLHSYRYAENTIISAIALLTRSKKLEQEVEAEIRARQAQTQSESRLAGLARRREQMARKLDKTLDAMLDADDRGCAPYQS